MRIRETRGRDIGVRAVEAGMAITVQSGTRTVVARKNARRDRAVQSGVDMGETSV
jgi:hypothetical protein